MNYLTLATLMSMIGFWGGLLVANAVYLLFMAFLFQWLWNAVLPLVFHLPFISYLQAARLLGLIFVIGTVVRGVKFKFQARL